MTLKKNALELKKEQAQNLALEDEIKNLCAKDVMIKPVFLYENDSAGKILSKLKKEHINACIVVNEEKNLVGEISDTDIIKLFLHQVNFEPLVKILNHGYRREFIYKTAKDMVNKHNSSVKKDTPINTIIKLVWKKGFEYIPILDNNEKVIGVITPSSIINLLKDF